MRALLAYLARMEGYISIQEMLQQTGTHKPAVCKRCGHVMNVQKTRKCDECGSSDVLVAAGSRSVRPKRPTKGLGNPKQPR